MRPEALHQRHGLTPYAGRTLDGVVEATYLAGRKIFERGRFLGPPRGRISPYGLIEAMVTRNRPVKK